MKLVLAAVIACAAPASAEPLRLRADALASTASPAGLLVLETDTVVRAGLSAEAVVWMANAHTPGEDSTGDVLVITVRSRGETSDARLGRFVSTLGALRPVHVDGGGVRVKLPRRFDAEVVAGIPVVPGLVGEARSWDWVVASRLSRRIGDGGSVGIAYARRHDNGMLANEELGVDAGATIGKRGDAGARLAYDLANPGLAEIALTSSYRRGALRGEVYAIHRDASHLLPATSLFSVIGDVPSQRAGGIVTWRAAPRLDVIGDMGARYVDGMVGAELTARARLRLDDRGKSALTGELRRSGVGDDMWTGARGTARIAVSRTLALSSEVELVVPDVDRGRGAVWPWALAALTWGNQTWQAALAVEASASPEYQSRVDVLGQLGRRWGK